MFGASGGANYFAAPRKLRIFFHYDDHDIGFREPDYVLEDPVFLGGFDEMLDLWMEERMKKAIAINRQGPDYDIRRCNCHTVTTALNSDNPAAVQRFIKERGILLWGAKSGAITIPDQGAQGGELAPAAS